MQEDIFFVLNNIFKKMRKIADRELQAFGFTHTEMRLLNMIYFYDYDADGCTQEDFIKHIEIDRSNIGRSLKKLESLGYIRREKNTEDLRAFRVFLTEKGRSIKDQILQIRSNIRKTFSIDMTAKEFKSLLKLLKRADINLIEENYKGIKSVNDTIHQL